MGEVPYNNLNISINFNIVKNGNIQEILYAGSWIGKQC